MDHPPSPGKPLSRFRTPRRGCWRCVRVCIVAVVAQLAASSAFAVAYLPVSDAALRARADAIVLGTVVATQVVADAQGRPDTVTRVRPIDVLKGQIAGDLVLHQLGGRLPDGRVLDLPGRPQYVAGTEVLVFAIHRPEGGYQTAEMLLGKFEIVRDKTGTRFARPALAGSDAVDLGEYLRLRKDGGPAETPRASDFGFPRELAAFSRFLRDPSVFRYRNTRPIGSLTPVRDAAITSPSRLKWYLGSTLARWNNGATAAWVLDGTANMTGGGVTEATNALAAWTDAPDTQIAYTATTNPNANPIHMSALTSPCGWSSCISGSGVVGCGMWQGGGSNVWRGDTYDTITSGEVWLRQYCTVNVFSSIETQSILEHELGHTLGLGHSDQGISPHDLCVGDESSAIMTSTVQDRTSLGSDDIDAVRWLYGDGGNSCMAADLSLSPDTTLDLGDARVGGTSGTMSVTLANSGSGPANIASIGASGDFAVTDNCASTVPAGGSCTIDVVFAPAQIGARAGTLTVHPSSGADLELTLAGYGEKSMLAAGTSILVPVVAHTTSYDAEVYVRNGNATPITLVVGFDEADNSSTPGPLACGTFVVPANATRVLTLAAQCTLGAGPHFGMLTLNETTGTFAFTAFARTETPAGVGFTVEARPVAAYGPGPALVDGLKRSSTGPMYLSNCFAGALGTAVTYRIDLTTSNGVAIGAPIVGSLQPYHMLRYLDVLTKAAAPAGDYSGVRATFTQTSPGGAPLVAFCTMQESVTFSADFRIAKPNDVAAPSIVVPIVARTASYGSEVYVRNAGTSALTVNVTFDEADNSSQPGVRNCGQLAVPVNATTLLSLASQCSLDTSPHFGMLRLVDAAVPAANPFTVFTRSQTPAGVGFSVEGAPIASLDGATRYVEGLRRTASGPHYLSNCFVGALGAPVAYRIDLADEDGTPIGAALTGSLAPQQAHRYLDVLAAAGAPSGDYAGVTARFSETSGSGATLVGYCTMQESVTFGADFRLAE